MKPHLPLSLLKSLLLVTSFVGCTVGTANAICMHTDATFQTYADFGQNMGRYVVGNKVNALVRQIRENDGGIAIQYTTGADPYIIPNSQGMINLTATIDEGDGTMISPTFLASVEHVWSLNASFSQRLLGDEHRVSYSAIDIYGSNIFRLNPLNVWGGNYDYVVQRQSKVVTDATWNELTTVTDINTLVGQHLYHSGAGAKALYDASTGVTSEYGWAYQFITGGINRIHSVQVHEGTSNISVFQYLDLNGASDLNPLPFAIRSGDSGSPSFIYNSENNRYEYLAGQQSGGGTMSQARGDLEYTREKLVQFDVNVEMPESGTLYLNAVNIEDETRTDNGGRTGTEWHGTITNAQGEETVRFAGVKTGVNTWASLHELKDTQNWYAYTSDNYLQVSDEDLFFTDNLLFNTTGAENEIILKDTVDLGIGYAGFSGGSYTIKSEGNEGNLFNHAGYVINAGAEVHLQLNNKADYMYEWRKTGSGDLYIDGQGATNALLVLGGTGSTYLQQQGGHAAYNVLVGSGARVVIADKAQIERDFTFGNGGGILDMNGNSMDWYNSGDTEGLFTINALTEEAIITNNSGNVTLTYKQGGENTWLGSFKDSVTGSLHIDYQGGGVLTLHSIHTDLSQSEGSGMTVTNGRVVLVGTNTLHGKGSVNGQTGERLLKTDDWHYADSAMNVSVKNGATFELGSHARLTGDVMVSEGGTFIMREGVQHRMEYVEGGAFREDTNQYADYFGLKGNVELDGDMRVEFNEGVDSRLSYNGNISGAGSLSIDLGTEGAILELGGDNSRMSGTKRIESGGVVLVTSNSSGNTSDNKWRVSTEGWIANPAESAEQLLARVDEGSTGTMALSADTVEQLDMQHHQALTLGAEIGKTVQYGEAGTNVALEAWQGAWRLGGGGGELVVNFKLSGENDLILGASGHSTGTVTLTNTQNDFSGDIIFSGKGIVLNTVDGALGNSVLHLAYGNGFGLTSADSITKNVGVTSDGMVTVDAVSNQLLNVSGYNSLAIAAEKEVEFSGGITLSAGQGYLFSSASSGKLTLLSELDSSRSLVIDAQGFTGGTVVLAGNDSWSGDITVRGHRDNNGEGEISLQLGRDVAAGGTLTLAQGGILDLAGHNLSISGTIVTVGGQMKNSGSTGALIFDCSAHELTSTADLSVGTIRKTGSNMLSLGGNNAPCQFYVEEGTLRLVSDGAFTSGSTVHLGDGSTLDNRTHALLAGVSLENGTATLTSSNHNHIVVRGSVSIGDDGRLIIGKDGLASISIDGDLSVGSGSSLAILSNSGASFIIGGNINLTEGTNLNFGNSANISLRGENIGTSGSTIVLNGGQLNLNKGGNISINSDLTINGNTTINSRGSADAMGRNFERVVINGGALTLWEESWSSVWDINSLEGSGNLHWQSTTNHNTSSRLILNGDGDFVGSISMNRTYRNNNRTHGAYLELASDFVATKADISLNGDAANAVASLAINTDNAHIKGLSGNQHSFVYAGAARVDTALSGSARPETTRSATLTIDADADYTFSGSIGNTADTRESGISLVKTGSGSQTINGASAVLNNVRAQSGSLNITAPSLTVNGNVELAYGATLKLGDSFTLNEGQNLSLMSVSENRGSAVLNSSLVLNGGTISIDARGISEESPLLALGGAVTVGSNFGGFCQLEFSNTSGVSMGTDYLVSTGDWSLLNNRISVVNSDFSNATFTASSTGLSVMFTLKDGFLLWEGEERILQSGNKVVFNGSNGYSTVNLTQDAALGTGYFNNAETVSISGAAISIGTLQKQDTGALQIDADVSVDNMVVKDATTIGGDGTLTVGSLTLESDLTTRMAVQVGDIQAPGVKWTVDGTDNAFTQHLTLEQVNATGGMNVEGQATLELNVTGGNYDNPRSLGVELAGTGNVALVGNGSLLANHQQHINLSYAELTDLILKGSSTDITGDVNINGRLSIGREDVRLTEGAMVTVTHFRMGDTASGQSSTVTIEEGATLNVTGREDGDNTSASFLLSHWKSSFSTLVLNGGTIISENARMHMGWDSGARFEALTGEATLKGIYFSSQRYHADTLVLGEARLNIGSGGITGIGSNDTVQLGNGTIAATANFSISGNKAIDLVGTAAGTTFDTAGHTITVNTVLQGEGCIIKTGSGTLNLAATNTFTGSLEVQDGTLQLSAAQNAGNYHMAEGTTLSVTHAQGEVNIAALPNTITLSKNGSGTLNMGSAQLSALTLKGNGSTTISGEVSVASLMEVGTESVVLSDGAEVSVNQLRLGTSARNQQSTLSLDAGAMLTVTGDSSADNEGVSLMLAHWHESSSTLHLNGGTLNAQNASMHMGWDSGGTFRGTAGVANLNGVLFSSARGNADTFILEGARLNIGSGGISGIASNDTVQLGSGTIAAMANFTISGHAIELTDEITGTTFDTNGHNITVNTSVNGSGRLVKEGEGALVLESNALGILTTSSGIVVNGGKLDLTAATIAAGSSALLDSVSGSGTVMLNYGVSGNGTAFDFSGLTGEVQVNSGRVLLSSSVFGEECPDFLLTSSNSQLVFDGNGTVVNSNVHVSANTTDLHVNRGKSGTIGGDVTGNSLVKQGGGILTVGGNMKLSSMLSTRAGEIVLTGSQNSIGSVDGAMSGGNTAQGTLRLAQYAHLEITGDIWGRSSTGIHLDSGAELDISGQNLSIANRAGDGTASLAATTSTGPGKYAIDRTDYQISNAHVTYTGGDATINNILTNVAVENAGNGILQVNNGENSLSAVHATGGSVKLFSDSELELRELEVASCLSVSAYCQESETPEQVARINVSGTATFGADAMLNADLVMKSGATLSMSGAVEVDSDVRLENGLSLDGELYNAVKVMQAGERLVLFSGIDSLYLGNATEATSAFTLLDGVQANDYFANLSDYYILVYDTSAGIGEGSLNYDESKYTLSITLTKKNIWVGGKGASWVQGSNVGWADGETFTVGNQTLFNTKGTVTITGDVEPASVLVDVDKSLTFKTRYNKKTGLYSGSIVGKGCIVKRGAGKLTMNDGNTYSSGTFIEAGTVNAKGTTSFGTGAITLSGGTLNLASKAVANDITLNGAATIKSGKKFLGSYTQNGGELMKGSVLNIAESATISGGVVNGTLSGVGTVTIDGDVELGKTGKITTNKLLVDGTLSASTKGLAMNTKASAVEINGGSLTSAGKLSAYSLTMTGGELEVSNAKPMSVSLKSEFKAASDADIDVYGAFSAAKLDLQGVTFTMDMADEFVTAKNTPKAQSISLKDKYADNLISDSVLNIGGKMSVAGNLTINAGSELSFYDPSTKNSAQSLAVKGSLNFGGGSRLYLNGSLSAKDLTLGSGTLTLNGAKLATVKVGNSLTLEGGTTLNLGFSVKEKDMGKSFKIFTFRTISPSITDIIDVVPNDLLCLGTDSATLTVDTKSKAITLTVTNVEAWNKYAESVRNGTWGSTSSEDDELVESAGAFVLARPAAAVDPLLGKVADTLVQSTWGTAGASRSFGDTIAARGTHATALADGKGSAWISIMGGSSRISSDGAHAGADYTLTGAAFGMEARLSEKSTVGLAIGNSWGKVSTFSAFPVDQDSTHQGIYGKHLLGSSTTLSWMAAHTRTESDGKLAGMACDWTQDALQLDARVDKLFAISDRTTVSAFVGMQYLATDKGECNGLSTGSLQNLRGEIGVSATHKTTDKAYVYGELSFIGDMVRHNPTATVGDYRSRGANPGRAGLNLSVGASYQLNDSWSLNGSYSLELMQNQTSHRANVGATYSF